MPWHRHTSLTNFTIQQSRSFEGVCIALRLMNCLFPVPDSQPTANELFQSPLYGSGTVFLLRHFLSSALAWRHTSSNSATRNYCCRARKVTLSFMDTLIALTYLLVHIYLTVVRLIFLYVYVTAMQPVVSSSDVTWSSYSWHFSNKICISVY